MHAGTKSSQGLTAKELLRKRASRAPELESVFVRLITAVQGMPSKIEKTRMLEAENWVAESKPLSCSDGEFHDGEGEDESREKFEDMVEFFSYA